MHAFQNHYAAKIVMVAADRPSVSAQHEIAEYVHRYAQQGHAKLHMVRAVAHDSQLEFAQKQGGHCQLQERVAGNGAAHSRGSYANVARMLLL